MSDDLTLHADSLLSKHGFHDGDCPDEFLDWLDGQGLPHPDDWHPILVRLVREHLLPLLPGVEVYEIGTPHNPIRAEVLPDGSLPQLPDVRVLVPFDEIDLNERGHR